MITPPKDQTQDIGTGASEPSNNRYPIRRSGKLVP